jgi:hypothetical protein
MAMETPEWDIFERLEKLEPKIRELEPVLDRVGILSVATFELFFAHVAAEHPSFARQYKDLVVSVLKKSSISREVVEVLDEFMLKVCERCDEQR